MRLMFREKVNNLILHFGIPWLLRLISPHPSWANIRVTENCNSRCITCNAWKKDSRDELTTEEVKDAFRQLWGVGVKNLIFVGGEPLLRSDIGDLIKEASRIGFENIIVVTNGLLLEKKSVELVNSGVTHVTVSIDGFGSSNDEIRGIPGSYEISIRGIKAVQDAMKEAGRRVEITILTTILLKNNFRDVPKLIEVARKLDVYWSFNLLDPNLDIFCGIPFHELLVQDEKVVDEVLDHIEKVHRESPWLVYTCDHMLEYARNYLKGKKPYDFHCVHGYKMIYLGAHGEVYPGCWVMEPLGNLRRDRLCDLIGSEKHREAALKMYHMECPGCTNRYEVNVSMKHLLSHWLFCRERKRPVEAE